MIGPRTPSIPCTISVQATAGKYSVTPERLRHVGNRQPGARQLLGNQTRQVVAGAEFAGPGRRVARKEPKTRIGRLPCSADALRSTSCRVAARIRVIVSCVIGSVTVKNCPGVDSRRSPLLAGAFGERHGPDRAESKARNGQTLAWRRATGGRIIAAGLPPRVERASVLPVRGTTNRA